MYWMQAGNIVDDDLEEEELEFSDDEKVLLCAHAAAVHSGHHISILLQPVCQSQSASLNLGMAYFACLQPALRQHCLRKVTAQPGVHQFGQGLCVICNISVPLLHTVSDWSAQWTMAL